MGANQSAQGDGQGAGDHQRPPGDRPDRQARRLPLLDHRPAQRHGRARDRRAGQHAGRPHGLRRRLAATASPASGPRRTWPSAPGLKAVDLFEAVHEGRIKALWIMATNPAVSLPNAGRVREALARCPFVVVSDCVGRHRHPGLRPCEAAGPGLGREGRHGHQFRAPHLAPAPGLRRPRRGARRLAHRRRRRAPPWASARPSPGARPGEVFREYARLTAFENDGRRPLNLGPLGRDRRARLRRRWSRCSGR